jgi:hypothetical protein
MMPPVLVEDRGDEQPKARATRAVLEGFAQMDAEEEARHQEKLRRWQVDWEAQEAQLQSQEHMAQIDKDVRRSGLLSGGVAEGLKQTELGKAAKIKLPYVAQLLRYYRFNKHIAAAIKIPEFRFRQYWLQIRDPAFTKRKGKEVEEYEQQVFADIAAKIEAGELPALNRLKPRDEKPSRLKGVSRDAALEKQIRLLVRTKRKEVRDIYREIEADIQALMALLGRDRNTLAPDRLAIHAEHLKRGWEKLRKALSVDDVEVVPIADAE